MQRWKSLMITTGFTVANIDASAGTRVVVMLRVEVEVTLYLMGRSRRIFST